jgi:nitrogen fixation protein NifU and related proteins
MVFWHDFDYKVIERSTPLERRMSYSSQVLDHFQHPRNVGDLENADATARQENPVCGDIMDLAVSLADGRISQVRFRGRGCVASIAAGSCLTELIQGKSPAEAASLSREQLLQALGGLPNASIHASHLAMDVLATVLKKLGPSQS